MTGKIEISNDSALLGPWICARIGKTWNPDAYTCVGLAAGERVLACSMYEGYTKQSIQIHVAVDSPNAPIRKFLAASFHYPFVYLGCGKLLGLVNSSNKPALTFDLKLGFVPEAVIPDVYPDGDLVIVTMNRADCRWIPAEHRRAA